MAWEILYDDGSRFGSKDGAYWQAPRTGVQAVLQDEPNVGVELAHSPDGWWFWKDGRWWGSDREGVYDYLRTHMSPELCVVQGRWVSHERWAEIQAMVRHRKSAWYYFERRVAP